MLSVAPDMIVVDRFMERVFVMPNGCWEWQGSKFQRTGYGMFHVKSTPVLAHRFCYETLVGPLPRGWSTHLHHRCSVRHCVNPAHLEPLKAREHVRIGTSPAGINARKTHCKRGHEFTPENTYRKPGPRRVCRICKNAEQRERYHRA